MNRIAAALIAFVVAAPIAPVSITAAEAATVTKRVTTHYGKYGHGCRKVVTTIRSHGRIIRKVRRVCR